MSETQNIEYKSSWHEEYLKWICGFANAQGGRIFIGKDNAGKVVGVEDYKKLMDEIPNKIKNLMGITAEVNLLQKEGKHFIEIIVLSYSVPISLRGRYYYRSGSVKQELTGAALNEFLLKRAGHTWDDVIEARASFDDIDEKTVKIFLRKAEEVGRLPDIDGLSMPKLLEKLRLAENGQLKRAAIVLFGKDPGRFYPNIFVKIGKFENDDFTIRFQEVEEGNLIQVLDRVLRTLDYKFLIRNISFEGMNRIETLEYPIPALREMLLNALVHRNYMGAPTQVRVYDSKMFVWNDGGLPATITLLQLTQLHSSHPRNPILAGACFLGGYIDSWGSGIMKIINSCKAAGLPTPELNEKEGGFIVTLFRDKFSEEELQKIGLNTRQIKAVLYVKEKGRITNKEYQKINQISKRTAVYELIGLVETYKIFKQKGESVGTYYEIE
ncbi:MAG: putative DNA binding domain-containing protein [Bacteroidetes bacterium]|nr:putative DNA binding domain-containing protein [Bacteroidota bacterium]MCL2302181.1 putative DNA binding domain-containing protein [Lentimicrobiaceae bacterium]